MILCSEGFGQNGWQYVSSPDNKIIYNMKACGEYFIYFYDDCPDCLYPGPGRIFISQDGGVHWFIDSSFYSTSKLGQITIGSEMRSLFFLNSNSGFLSGINYENQYGGNGTFDRATAFIQHSSDQGHSWSNFSMPTETLINKIFFISDSVGYAIGSSIFDYTNGYHGSETINQTTDGGSTWDVLGKWKDTGIGEVIFADSLTFFAYRGSKDSLLLTLDRGKTWQYKNGTTVAIAPAKAIYNLFYHKGVFYATCDTGFMKSLDWVILGNSIQDRILVIIMFI